MTNGTQLVQILLLPPAIVILNLKMSIYFETENHILKFLIYYLLLVIICYTCEGI